MKLRHDLFWSATTVYSSVDAVKVRIMAASTTEQKVLSVSTLVQMYRVVEGLASFFKRWTPAVIRLSPQTFITFVVLEPFKKWHEAFHKQNFHSRKSLIPLPSALS